ncbi:MAG: cell cycle transcriptional regulator TrcR [Emcibacteraceae bacterium]
MTEPLMPLATGVWLVDNTSLSFAQIAKFCGLHELEVQGIADEQVAVNIVGLDPVANGQLTWEEIERCQNDPNANLQIVIDDVPAKTRSGGAKYTPVSKRQDKPDAIAWLLRHHPELTDAQISKIVGTTKPTITAIRERTHWNMSNIKPIDPVLLGLCKQTELDAAVKKAAPRRAQVEDEGQNAE